jgi:hypothetical protein
VAVDRPCDPANFVDGETLNAPRLPVGPSEEAGGRKKSNREPRQDKHDCCFPQIDAPDRRHFHRTRSGSIARIKPANKISNRPDYLSVRADNGMDHSKAKPSFMPGAVGGCGCVKAGWPADFVSAPIASLVTVGDCQACRVARPVPLDLVGRIIRLRINNVHKRSMG